jgi:hypothetical protein
VPRMRAKASTNPIGRRLTRGGVIGALTAPQPPRGADLAVLVSAEESFVVLHRHTAVRVAVRPQHIGMREEPGAAVDAAVADRIEAQSLNPVEERLPHGQLIDMRRRRTLCALLHIARIVQPVAQARMGLDARSIRCGRKYRKWPRICRNRPADPRSRTASG